MLRTMKISVVFFILSISILNHITVPVTAEIEPIELRIRHLKSQLFDEIKSVGNKPPVDSDHYKDTYDYVDNSQKPIVPISDDDERKINERYKQPELKPTTTTKFVASPENTEEKRGPLRSKKQKKKKNIETFYRRMAFNANERDKPQKWTHCLDLLSPFLNGFLSNVTEVKKVTATSPKVWRLRRLLTMDMTHASPDEIRSLLYEISNINLRMFQWDTGALRVVLNTLLADQPHDFKGLKHGLKSRFATWKLNTSNLTRILTQSRIFRPPCIQISEYAGSTVTPKSVRYTKPKKPAKNSICVFRNGEEDCYGQSTLPLQWNEDQERDEPLTFRRD